MVIVNALSVIAYLASTLYLLKICREHLVYFGYVSFMLLWSLISCFYNDLGIFNVELRQYTETTLATTRLAVFLIVFNFGFFIAARLIGSRPLARVDYSLSKRPVRAGYFKFIAYTLVSLVIIYILYTFFTEGIPILAGINRLEYFQQSGPLIRSLIVYGSLITFFLGYYLRRRGRFAVNAWIMVAFIIFIILVGHKFSLLLSLLVAYYAPIYVRYLADRPEFRLFSWKKAMGIASLAVIFVVLAFGSYRAWLGDSAQAYHLFVNRVLVFQGEMWWAVDNDVSRHGRYDDNHVWAELDNIISPGDTNEGEIGMKYLMVKVLGPETAYAIFDRGYLYTMTYPAILIATFPYGIALALQFLAGMVFFAMLYYLYYSIRYRHTFRALITLLILLPYISMLFTGNFHTFFTFGMVIKIATVLVLEFPAVNRGLIRQERAGS